MPAPPDLELAFDTALALEESAELALEDYARVVTQAGQAFALHTPHDPALVRGVGLEAPALAVTPALARDIEDFARALTFGRDAPGLGWS